MGDYRFLEGEMSGNRLMLSAFDGSHLFLFSAIARGDSLLDGHYFSGKHWHDTWSGVRDEKATLPPAESLTASTPHADPFRFSFPDETSTIITDTSERFRGKTLIVQLMGSWCPNCMDETKFLSEWYNEHRGQKTEVVAFDYERITDTATVNNNIRRLKKQFNIKYPVLFAGSNDKQRAARALPQLSRVFAFPTLIFLDEKRNIIKTHTGFSGPATGEEYFQFVEWFKETVAGMQ
jgi:thiol-disulfide isomerase/thioredoxin